MRPFTNQLTVRVLSLVSKAKSLKKGPWRMLGCWEIPSLRYPLETFLRLPVGPQYVRPQTLTLPALINLKSIGQLQQSFRTDKSGVLGNCSTPPEGHWSDYRSYFVGCRLKALCPRLVAELLQNASMARLTCSSIVPQPSTMTVQGQHNKGSHWRTG